MLKTLSRFTLFISLGLASTALISTAFAQDSVANQNNLPSEANSNENGQVVQAPAAAPKQSAYDWLKRMTHSLRTLNFNSSFVVVQDNRAEPYHWFHGVHEGTELEVLALLNGPRFEAARKGEVVSYFEPTKTPYSVVSRSISGPIPNAFTRDIEDLAQSYNFVSVGRSRILARPARLIRIISKDRYRHNYWVWLDEQSGLLLKAAMIGPTGELLEQIQITHLEITDDLAPALLHLVRSDLPAVIDGLTDETKPQFDWRLDWIPTGFHLKTSNQHKLSATGQMTDFMLFNDGLVDISIYVGKTKVSQREADISKEGATTMLSLVRDNREISVVGKIPAITAKQIADSVNFSGFSR